VAIDKDESFEHVGNGHDRSRDADAAGGCCSLPRWPSATACLSPGKTAVSVSESVPCSPWSMLITGADTSAAQARDPAVSLDSGAARRPGPRPRSRRVTLRLPAVRMEPTRHRVLTDWTMLQPSQPEMIPSSRTLVRAAERGWD
jgi:hypothetical protein